MPEISRFLGIIISMLYGDHNPPHFHVKYAEYKAVFDITNLKMIEGKLPNRVLSLVLEWAFIHREDLLKDWELMEKRMPLNKIDPLE